MLFPDFLKKYNHYIKRKIIIVDNGENRIAVGLNKDKKVFYKESRRKVISDLKSIGFIYSNIYKLWIKRKANAKSKKKVIRLLDLLFFGK